MTRTEIRAQARLLSNEASTARFSDAQVNSLIDDAQTIVATQIGWKAVSANISVTLGTQTVTMPTDLALGGIREAWWYDYHLDVETVGGQTAEDLEWLVDPTSGTPSRLICVGSTWYLDRKPSQTKNVKIIFTPVPTDLATDATVSALPTQVHKWMAYQTAILMCELTGNAQAAQALQATLARLSEPYMIAKLNEGHHQIIDTWSEGQ